MTFADAVARLVREERARVLAVIIRLTGNIDIAEDATQDAIVRALDTWPRDGVPASPRAWLVVTAKRRAVDIMRREAQRTGKESAASMINYGDSELEPDVPDDLLRLIFTCCHPALAVEAQVALALRTLGGLTTAEAARGLLVSEATMAKRITRAKRKIRQAGIPYRIPPAEALPARIAGVAATVYLIFNEGYAAGEGGAVLRVDLSTEAVRLARLLADLMPDEPAILGLLALVLLQDARRAARLDDKGYPLLLSEQDRSRWNTDAIREGVELVGRALRRTPDQPEPYVIEAAIAACHALAPSYDRTDWNAVVSWYDVLVSVRDTDVVRLNRAVAVGEREGAATALPLVDALDSLDAYPWWHATRAELLARLDRPAEAEAAYRRALELGMSDPHQRRLRSRLAELDAQQATDPRTFNQTL